MRFQADVASPLVGGILSVATPNSSWPWAPERAIYPDVFARPTATAVSAFLRDNDINYIYVDVFHPNVLLPDARIIASIDGTELLRIP